MVDFSSEDFFNSLEKEEKVWLSFALTGMICADKAVEDDELEFFQLALDLLDQPRDVETISKAIIEGAPIDLPGLIINDRRKAYEMLSLLASVSISDGFLAKSEERFLLDAGEKVGFEKDFVLEISKVSYEKLKVIQMEANLVKKAEAVIG